MKLLQICFHWPFECSCVISFSLGPPSLAQMFGKGRNAPTSALGPSAAPGFPSNEMIFKVTTSSVRATRDYFSPSKTVKVGEIDGVAVVVRVSHPNSTNKHGGSKIAAMLKVLPLACFALRMAQAALIPSMFAGSVGIWPFGRTGHSSPRQLCCEWEVT